MLHTVTALNSTSAMFKHCHHLKWLHFQFNHHPGFVIVTSYWISAHYGKPQQPIANGNINKCYLFYKAQHNQEFTLDDQGLLI